MAKTAIRQVHFDRLRSKAPDAAIIVKLMMACNDLSTANQALDDWKRNQPKDRVDKQIAACTYFVRVEISHLYEALKIIKQIADRPPLLRLVDQCDARTRASFADLKHYIHGGAKHNELKKLVGEIRHNLTFHYHQCDALIGAAIEERAGQPESRLSSITRGSTAHLWRFQVADDIVDSIVVRKIWSVPRSADLRTEVDKIADRIQKILETFVDFTGEFIWKYCE